MTKRFKHMTFAFALAGFFLLMASVSPKAFAEKPNEPPDAAFKVGIIDDMSSSRIVIGDVTYKLRYDTRYLSATGKEVERWSFTKGETVKYLVDDAYHMLILKKT